MIRLAIQVSYWSSFALQYAAKIVSEAGCDT